MGTAHRWDRNRFGILFQANLATVPAWAPIGASADWYRAHIDGTVPDTFLQPSPMAESLAHHRDRWAHVEDYDDFVSFLSFDEFDPTDWVDVVRSAGASYLIQMAKDRDGWCWWDAPATERTMLRDGPRRNVFAELASACADADLMFGAQYSLLDWSDPRYRTPEYAAEVVRPHVLDLVERYGIDLLWGDGQWAGGESRWQTNELLDAVRDHRPNILVNDRWSAHHADVRTYEYLLPHSAQDQAWEMRRGLGGGLGRNRTETADHLLDGRGIVSLLTEVISKNGHLLLAVGPDATGKIDELHRAPLETAGGWIDAHRALVERGRPWDGASWGDAGSRLIDVDGDLHLVDVGGNGHFAALGAAVCEVEAVEEHRPDDETTPRLVEFEQDAAGLHIARRQRSNETLGAVYLISLAQRADAPIELFPTTTALPIELAPLLDDARPGEIIRLGDGIYIGPARIPDGVTVRGLGPHRTVIDGLESTAVTLGDRSRVEHCTLRGGGTRIVWLPLISVRLTGRASSLLGCHVDGHIQISGDAARVTSCAALGIVVADANQVSICRSTFTGTHWDCAIDITGGAGHEVDSCEFRDHLIAIRLTATVGTSVRGNQITARWWGVQLVDTEGTTVNGNSIGHTMRAVDVDGGTLAEITGNAVHDGDSGCVVQRGSSEVTVAGNRWERCRIGLLLWDAVSVTYHDNDGVDLAEPSGLLVTGP